MPDDRYLFDHLPRTGGTSLNIMFEQLFGSAEVSPPLCSAHASQAIAQMPALTMITGHFWHSPGSLANRSRCYLTILRRPEDRIQSLYGFYRHGAVHTTDEVVALAKELSFDAFVMSDRPAVLDRIQNPLVRHFAQFSIGATGSECEMWRAAAEALEQYDFVGIYEDFELSVDAMCWRFRWRSADVIPWANRSPHPLRAASLDGDVRTRLHRLSAADSALYERGLQLWAQRKRAMMRRFIDLAREPADASADRPVVRKSAEVHARTPANFGDKAVEILTVTMVGTDREREVFQSGEMMTVALVVVAHETVTDVTVGFAIRNAFHQLVFGTNSYHLGQPWQAEAGRRYEVTFEMPLTVNAGRYFITAALHAGPSHLRCCHHWWEDAASLDVLNEHGRAFDGLVNLDPALAIRLHPHFS
jgi:hypothetical protein